MDYRDRDYSYNKKHTVESIDIFSSQIPASNLDNRYQDSDNFTDNRREFDDVTHESLHLHQCKDIVEYMAEEKNEVKKETVKRKLIW